MADLERLIAGRARRHRRAYEQAHPGPYPRTIKVRVIDAQGAPVLGATGVLHPWESGAPTLTNLSDRRGDLYFTVTATGGCDLTVSMGAVSVSEDRVLPPVTTGEYENWPKTITLPINKPQPVETFPQYITVRDPAGEPYPDAQTVVQPDLGDAVDGVYPGANPYAFTLPNSVNGTGCTLHVTAIGFEPFAQRFVAHADNPQITLDGGQQEVHLQPIPTYKLPSAYTWAELLAVRCAIWTHPGPWNYGPRPWQPDNITALLYNDCYSTAEQDEQFASYKAKGYTHCAVGPLVDGGYHGMYPAIDYRQQFDRFLDLLDRMWQHGLIPIVFLHLDNQSFDDYHALYDPLLRGNARARDLIRFVVPSGWEPTKYDWSSKTWARYGAHAREVLPDAVVAVHTVADVDAPAGVDSLHDDNTNPGGNADAWQNVAPNIHVWLVQSAAFEDPNGHGDPNHPENTNFQNWCELWNEANEKSYTNRFRNGYAGWPMTSASGNVPIRVIAFEYCSYWVCWDGRPAAEGDTWGDAAIAHGADGYGDGGTVAVPVR